MNRHKGRQDLLYTMMDQKVSSLLYNFITKEPTLTAIMSGAFVI